MHSLELLDKTLPLWRRVRRKYWQAKDFYPSVRTFLHRGKGKVH
jgi:hypothetical protein